MKNKMKMTTVLTTLVCLIPLAAGAVLYNSLPDTMAIHWGFDGTANGWASKLVAVFVLPGVLLILNLLFPVLLNMDPKNKNMDEKIKTLVHWIIPVVSVFCAGVTLAEACGIESKIALIGPMIMGVLFVAIGNFLPKTTQSYTVGIKLPWTLNSEENWNRTHRMAGFLWVAGGIVMIITALLGLGFAGMIAMIVLMAVVPTVYSYMLYRKGI